MAFSGVRPQVLGNIDGSDGLKIKDLPELEISARAHGDHEFLSARVRVLYLF